MLGETATNWHGGTLTVSSVEVVSKVETIDGDPMVAGAGEELVVIRAHFVNTGNATVDLSCSGVPDWLIDVYDTDQRQMAPMFKSYRIAGNPECNHEMLSGQESDWNEVYRAVEGATPRVFQVTAVTSGDFIAWALTDEPLRLAN